MGTSYNKNVERWDVFEVSCEGRKDGNPFTDHDITGNFKGQNLMFQTF